MIKSLCFKKYRKLENIEIYFSNNVNLISGANGTCKSSILHLISNSFQKMTKTEPFINNKKSIDVINKLNKLINPKIEGLTRGDKVYNDPAKGIDGELYKAKYIDEYELSFRRHNSSTNTSKRFAIKPQYKAGANDALPKIPIIYLGLFRLYSFGEFDSDNLIKKITETLPDSYNEDLQNIYYQFTGLTINVKNMINMGKIKNRADFSTNTEGIDSNTISAGEDNLFIMILALISLKYYFESIDSSREIESILLIDEFDASLHPSFQNKLLDLMISYSLEYKIQIAFTSHSLSLIEYSMKKADVNLIYLIDEIHRVRPMPSPDYFKISMHLKETTRQENYADNLIPILSEDDEAREIIEQLMTYHEEKYNFNIRRYFHIVKVNLSSESIKNLCHDKILLRSTLRSVNILDGDQQSNTDLNYHLIALPGGKSPEKLIFDYADSLYNDTKTKFWENDVLVNSGYTKVFYRNNIQSKLREIEKKIQDMKANNTSTKGYKREQNKKVYNEHSLFWRLVFADWKNNISNQPEIDLFFKNLNICYKKTAEFHGINSNEWNITYGQQ